jgi:hypothetical protein
VLSPLAVGRSKVVYPGEVGEVVGLDLRLGDAELVGELADGGGADTYVLVCGHI